MNKKNLTILIVSIIVATLLIAGGSFAFWLWTSNVNKNVSFNTANVEEYIIYDEGDSLFIGDFMPTDNYCESTNTTLSFSKKEEATVVPIFASIKMNINSIGTSIASSDDVYWVVTSGDNTSCEGLLTSSSVLAYGTFNGKQNGETLTLYSDIKVLTESQQYTVWLWIDSAGDNLSNLSGETIDVNVWTEFTMKEYVEENLYTEEILNGADPVLDDGMIPITLSSTGVATVADTSSEWYDYETKQWANAVLVKKDATADVEGSRSREYYLNNPGAIVLDSDILAYYVWIPRYKYQIWTTDASASKSPQTINIVFEDSSTTKSNGTSVGQYLTHPAFTFGSQELNGIWVGKFETTGYATTPTIKPNEQSLREQTVSTQFTTSLVFAGGTLTAGAVLFAGNDTYGLTTKADSHMMKNSEWGAVAYLSHSQYGINSEIYINNSSSYYTGRSGGNDGESVNSLSTQFGSGSTSTQYNSYGYYTWTGQAIGSDGTIGEITDATLGTKASTTGNITGVYDMSGGAFEYVMGNYAQTAGNSGFTTFPEAKYYDLYSSEIFTGSYSTNMGICTLDSCGGDALFETASWYSDNARFVSSDNSWFRRGGYYLNSAHAGAFFSSCGSGGAFAGDSWRSSLLVAD